MKLVPLIVVLTIATPLPVTATTYNYRVSFEYDTVGEFFKTIILSLYFGDQDFLYWYENEEGAIYIGNRLSGEPFFSLDPGNRTAYFLSSRTKKVNALENEQNEAIFGIYDMLTDNEMDEGKEFDFTYVTKDRDWAGSFAVGKTGFFTTGGSGGRYPCRLIRGKLVPSDSELVTPVKIYLGTEGTMANHVVRLEFEYPRWPKVKITIQSIEED